jgi:hypothetical protein
MWEMRIELNVLFENLKEKAALGESEIKTRM